MLTYRFFQVLLACIVASFLYALMASALARTVTDPARQVLPDVDDCKIVLVHPKEAATGFYLARCGATQTVTPAPAHLGAGRS